MSRNLPSEECVCVCVVQKTGVRVGFEELNYARTHEELKLLLDGWNVNKG